MKNIIILSVLITTAIAVPHKLSTLKSNLENRNFIFPQKSLSWKELARELAKDKIRRQTTNFNYKRGTKQFDDICGISNKAASKIVGGHEAEPNQFPWLVALFANAWFCSASLISDEWVLTAAHCVDGATSWDVYAGTHDLDLDSEPHRVVISSTESYVHPDWNFLTVANDIALIKLPEKFEFNDYIRPSCLPSHVDGEFDGLPATATGWGKISDESSTKSNTLHYSPNLPVITNAECKRTYNIITDGHLCIDTTGGHGVCNGDSGGPLNYMFPADKYKTIGVASFVSSLGCESGLPHAYTRVTAYLDWIETITGIQIKRD